MKVLSVLFLGFLFAGIFGSWLAFANDFVYTAANGSELCRGGISLSGQSGINSGLQLERDCGKSAFFGYGREAEPIATGLICPQKDDCDVFIGFSDSSSNSSNQPSNASIKRSVFFSSFKIEEKKAISISGKLLPAPKDPGSFFSMQITSLEATELRANNSSAASFNRLFIAGTQNTVGANDYFSFALNAEGVPTGAKSVIFSNPNTKAALGGSISRDGGIAVQLSATSSLWQLSTRLLKNGVPRKAPFSWTIPAYAGYSPDITNTIEVNNGVAGASVLKIRYLIYRAFRNVGTASQQSQIMIQTVDDVTGHPIGVAKPLTVFKNAFLAPVEAFQSLAIAPNGELMIFTEYNGACKKMILKAVRLVNGTVSGGPKVLAGCAGLASTPFGFMGIDIMDVPDRNQLRQLINQSCFNNTVRQQLAFGQ